LGWRPLDLLPPEGGEMPYRARKVSQALFVSFWILCAVTLGVVMSLLVFHLETVWLKASLVPLVVSLFTVLYIRDHYQQLD